MPKYWYDIKACGDNEYLKSICSDKKPYFMIYIYDDIKRSYKKYIKESNTKCMMQFGCKIDDLYNLGTDLTDEQYDFLCWYEKMMPVGMGNCAMNKICWYVESQLDGYKNNLKKNSVFDYNTLKVKRRCTEEHREQLRNLEQEYSECVRIYKSNEGNGNKHEKVRERKLMKERFKKLASEICPSDEERMNIILDITYGYKGNRQFCWDTIGELIIENLRNRECA